MKAKVRLFGFIALAALIAFSVTGCNSDGDSSDLVSIPAFLSADTVGWPTGVPAVTTAAEAKDLLYNVDYAVIINDFLPDLDYQEFDRIFKDAHGGSDLTTYLASKSGEQSASYSVDIPLGTYEYSSEETTIGGRNQGSLSVTGGSKTLGEVIPLISGGDPFSELVDGDKVGMELSVNRTFTRKEPMSVTGGEAAWNMKLEGKEGQTYEMIDNANYKMSASLYKSNSAQAVWMLSDGTKAAKFRFSAANNLNETVRSYIGNGGEAYSDIEVLDKDNQRILVISFTESIANFVLWQFVWLALNFAYNGM